MQYRVLLIDDDQISGFISKKYVVRSGYAYEVLIAESGPRALQIIKNQISDKQPIDVILLDLNMPMISGCEFLIELAALDDFDIKRVFIIILSNSMDEDEISAALACGANHFIPKPLDENSIFQSFEQYQIWKVNLF
ncbi:MAG: response regulator [Cyclobacteriaceae bacterium]|nr:response regulator [Cyclobacteriaceae bacterium]